jgi:hypothetical protein
MAIVLRCLHRMLNHSARSLLSTKLALYAGTPGSESHATLVAAETTDQALDRCRLTSFRQAG